jgi:hypothetical protein
LLQERERLGGKVRRKREFFEVGDSNYDQYRLDSKREDLELNLLTDILSKYWKLKDPKDLIADRGKFIGNLYDIMQNAKKEFTLNPFEQEKFKDLDYNGSELCKPLTEALEMMQRFDEYEKEKMDLKFISENDYIIRFSTNRLLGQYIRDVRSKCKIIGTEDEQKLRKFEGRMPVYQERLENFYNDIDEHIEKFNNGRIKKPENRYKRTLLTTPSDMVRNILKEQSKDILEYYSLLTELETEKISLKTLPKKLELYNQVIGPLVEITENDTDDSTNFQDRVKVYAHRLKELYDGVHTAIERYAVRRRTDHLSFA